MQLIRATIGLPLYVLSLMFMRAAWVIWPKTKESFIEGMSTLFAPPPDVQEHPAQNIEWSSTGCWVHGYELSSQCEVCARIEKGRSNG